MSNKINLYWYKINDGTSNFGDELNHYIVSRLSGQKINHVLIPSVGYDYIHKSLSSIYHKLITPKNLPKIIMQFFINDYIVGIGSVMSITRSSKAKIWGSGIIKKDAKIKKANFYAVRGKYTQDRLRELGLEVPNTIGDPSLLLPMLYTSKKTKSNVLGIVPHHIHYYSVKNKIKDSSILVIDLTDPIEKIIDEIASCKYIISTSLHGIIVAQAYQIPSLWYTFLETKLYGDDIKFYDYFSSVGIKEYEPFELIPEELNINQVIQVFKNSMDISNINIPIKGIQQKLIKIAPFSILEKYKPSC